MWGMSRAQVANLVEGVTKGFEKQPRDHRRRLQAAVAGKVLKLSLGYSHDVDYPDPGGHHDRDAEADRGRRRRHRQAAGRPDRRRDPRVPRAGALQGQGREVRRRIHLPQGRQEEVRTSIMAEKLRSRGSPQGARAPRDPQGGERPPAPVGLPFVEADLRPGHRRREAASRSPPPRRWRRTSRAS